MEKEIYDPILSQLEKKHGIKMVEESENPKGQAKMSATHNQAKL